MNCCVCGTCVRVQCTYILLRKFDFLVLYSGVQSKLLWTVLFLYGSMDILNTKYYFFMVVDFLIEWFPYDNRDHMLSEDAAYGSLSFTSNGNHSPYFNRATLSANTTSVTRLFVWPRVQSLIQSAVFLTLSMPVITVDFHGYEKTEIQVCNLYNLRLLID